MTDSVDQKQAANLYKNSPGKRLDLRLKSLEWAGKLNFPAITGHMVGIGQSKENQKYVLNQIAALHRQYGNVHEYLIQNFVPEAKTPFEKKKAADDADVLKAFEIAREILPSDIPITVNPEMVGDVIPFIKAGMRDLGRITENERGLIAGQKPLDFADLSKKLGKMGLVLQQRFPLRKSFVSEGRYSKKLGQVFESYRYKIKKESQEKVKELKAID
jgi:7,8-didemethyl-8-hydroxy-5-deazariboflavin synthase CofG subunit